MVSDLRRSDGAPCCDVDVNALWHAHCSCPPRLSMPAARKRAPMATTLEISAGQVPGWVLSKSADMLPVHVRRPRCSLRSDVPHSANGERKAPCSPPRAAAPGGSPTPSSAIDEPIL
jgi:hypothetical protein